MRTSTAAKECFVLLDSVLFGLLFDTRSRKYNFCNTHSQYMFVRAQLHVYAIYVSAVCKSCAIVLAKFTRAFGAPCKAPKYYSPYKNYKRHIILGALQGAQRLS